MKQAVTIASCAMSLLWSAVAQAEDQPYLLRLADTVSAWQAELPTMAASAKRAAENAIQGGRLYSFGPQPGFAQEAFERAGGLMMLKYYKSDTVLTERDTVLAAITEGADAGALTDLHAKAQQAGAQLIVFGSINLSAAVSFRAQTMPSTTCLISTESVSNAVGLWAWTGQFIAACVERGKMPCVYQSYLLPGGRERGAYLEQQNGGRFHTTCAVRVQDAAGIAPTFLNMIEQSLRQTWTSDQDALHRSAALLRAAHATGLPVAVYAQGHLVPAEIQQPPRPDWFTVTKDKELTPGRFSAAIALEYQATPWETLIALRDLRIPVIWTCSQPAAADLTAQPDHVYLNPHWPLADAVVDLAGYDVPLLPASGIMDAAVYWQLVELSVSP
ncbi:MAG: hypothetical protein IT445_18600 [Phycisphaeraceae bacterium]|nr:hypothetical protein [Phycisphaeraceae bacterium]